MSSKWIIAALLFSTAVNIAGIGTLIYLRLGERHPPEDYWSRLKRERPPAVMERRSRQRFQDWKEIDSLRLQYRRQMGEIMEDIERQRRNVALLLDQEPIDRKAVDKELRRLFESRLRAESLTVDQLIALKPKLSENEWRSIIRRLETPPRRLLPIEEDISPERFYRQSKEEKVIILKRTEKP
ncbi:MAG: periplasmic heavy metal sensor [candidate division KSB1 bacterium]|nr:periplasmic heavy metal sensor [candidate division KSB1 bacterium]